VHVQSVGSKQSAHIASQHVDERLHLSAADVTQIYRLVMRQTAQQIDSLYPGTKNGSIEVTCGYWEELSYGQRVTGDEFTVEKQDSTWRIVDKSSWTR